MMRFFLILLCLIIVFYICFTENELTELNFKNTNELTNSVYSEWIPSNLLQDLYNVKLHISVDPDEIAMEFKAKKKLENHIRPYKIGTATKEGIRIFNAYFKGNKVDKEIYCYNFDNKDLYLLHYSPISLNYRVVSIFNGMNNKDDNFCLWE